MNEPVVQTTHYNKPKKIFQNKNFLLLIFGKLISKLGDNIYIFALTWYVFEKYSSTAQAGIIMALGLIPVIFLGPFAGVMADRINRKKIIVIMDFAQGTILLIVFFLLKTNMFSIWVIYISTFLLGCCGALFNPACTAIIPNIVEEEQLIEANGADTAIGSISNIGGILGGGIAYALFGFTSICFFNAISFIISGIAEMFLTLHQKTDNCREDLQHTKEGKLKEYFNELYDGFSYLHSKKGLFILFIFFMAFNFLLAPVYSIYLPYIFNKQLIAGPSSLAYVQAASGIGMLVGAIIVSMFAKGNSIKLILFGLWCSNITVLGLAIPIFPVGNSFFTTSRATIAYIVLGAIMGVFGSFVAIPIASTFQRLIKDEFRGRVNALISTIVVSAIPLGYLLGGFMAEFIPVYIIIVTGAFLMVITVFMGFVSELKEI
ncbi:MFS transporter [Clostridium estertheticum]|uniref:MFS transporter n=1 Tax=Clostridium estertheticum TaxID=238834 RepID=UPI001CF5DB42|nr:MFS transporter [Clostridium estertheticum]MCB2354684.1 MFS transporter [Clostridium estertheticum]WAG40929.1 MFS transporter [Clostridium estertheticum]